MVNKGVRWNESETKKIYQANKESESLMEYLEKQLFNNDIVDSSADSPTPERGYGSMLYYSEGQRIVVAAPRKRNKHVHVILTNKVNMAEVRKSGIELGNQKTDIMITSNEDIDKLVALLKHELYKGSTVKDEIVRYKTRSLEEWVHLYDKDETVRFRNHFILHERSMFISDFTELDELRNGDIDILEFKKKVDQKTKAKLELEGERINLWGFSGFSGQMFFNLLYNMAEYTETVRQLQDEFLTAIDIPAHEKGDFSWTKEKYERFGGYIKKLKKKAIEQGFPPQKCPTIKYMTFFLSFFWGIQGIDKYPIYYKASRDGLEYLGYSLAEDSQAAEHNRYFLFVNKLYELNKDIVKSSRETYELDMMSISSFLYYVTTISEAEPNTDGDGTDPIEEDEFALQIRDVLFEEGYKFSQMLTADWEEAGLNEKYTDNLIWQYRGEAKEDMMSLMIIWEDEELYHADLYTVNEEGELQKGKAVQALDDREFISELKSFLQKRTGSRKPYTIEDAVKETYVSKESMEEWLELLTEKRQVIFYGPPGTGKTFISQRLAKILTQQPQLIELIQFHPSYTYEEFIEGLRPELAGEEGSQHLSVKVQPGIFTILCQEARKPENQEKSYVLIIDEINRANTAKVFGELLYALEYRNTSIPLPYSKKKLIVPENIYVIGTMNTTDRSLAQIDFALRRRFQFIPFSAKETEDVLKNYLLDNEPEMAWVADLVQKVNGMIDDPDISIGHSYFIGQELSMEKLRRIWKYQIMPYLEECFVHDRQKLEQFELNFMLEIGAEENE